MKEKNKIRVKIYGTLGPACADAGALEQMFRQGMDGIRLNLSHAGLEEASGMIEACRRAAEACGIRPELLIDMQGPELRVGRLKEAVRLAEDELIDGSAVPFPDEVTAALAVAPFGQQVLLDDGKILLEKVSPDDESDPAAAPAAAPAGNVRLRDMQGGDTENRNGARDGNARPRDIYGGAPDTIKADRSMNVRLRVVRGGILESRKSVALPGIDISIPAMTAGDREQIRKAAEFGVTAVMQPFVRGREDLTEVRSALDAAGCSDIRLLAKIENGEGVRLLDDLIPCCDEIVIARGDLGNDMELWELPAVQKQIAAACRRAGRSFMVVTQMLDSMMHRKVPTRAEVSDIFNAVLDGASSVMVTGETAAGEYPAEVIRYLTNTVREAERYRNDTL